MYSIERKTYDEIEKKYTYILEELNIDKKVFITFESDLEFCEGDLVNIVNDNLIILEEETLKRKNILKKKISNLFYKQ